MLVLKSFISLAKYLVQASEKTYVTCYGRAKVELFGSLEALSTFNNLPIQSHNLPLVGINSLQRVRRKLGQIVSLQSGPWSCLGREAVLYIYQRLQMELRSLEHFNKDTDFSSLYP